MRSERFANRVARELDVSARSPDPAVVLGMRTALQGNAQDACEWMRSLVYRKDLHLPGIPVDVRIPAGFTKGQQNGDGNNCFIGSCVQSLERRRVNMNDLAHTFRCRRIRTAGVEAGKWLWSPADIDSDNDTFTFVVSQLGLSASEWRCEIYGGNDGELRQRLRDNAAPNVCYLWNQCGAHFDPLWPEAVVPAQGNRSSAHVPQRTQEAEGSAGSTPADSFNTLNPANPTKPAVSSTEAEQPVAPSISDPALPEENPMHGGAGLIYEQSLPDQIDRELPEENPMLASLVFEETMPDSEAAGCIVAKSV